MIPPRASLSLSDLPARPACDELLLFVRTEGREDRVEWYAAGDADSVTVTSDDAATYVVIAYAGKAKA